MHNFNTTKLMPCESAKQSSSFVYCTNHKKSFLKKKNENYSVLKRMNLETQFLTESLPC